MSKRKREIQKRKKLAEDARSDDSFPAAGSPDEVEAAGDLAPDDPLDQELAAAESPVDDSQIVSDPRPAPVKKKPRQRSGSADQRREATAASDSLFGQYKENLLLGLLVIYVLLLGLGTVGSCSR